MPIEFCRDGPWELPEGWVWARAADFASIIGGGTPKNAGDEANFDPNGTPWITPADLSGYSAPHISRGARSLSAKGSASCSARSLPAGSLLISSRAPVGYCVVAASEVTTNQGFKSLVFKAPMCPEFFRYYVIYNRKYFIDNASGTTFKELSGEAMSELLFPVAPVAEQHRIVVLIDELLTEIADGETALARARDDLDTWHRALLKAAVTGELTWDWRELNGPRESGELVLRVIRATKAVKPGRAERNQELEPIELPDLPPTWAWGTIDDAVVSMEYGTSEKCDTDSEGLPVLRMGNIQKGAISFQSLKYLPEIRASDAPLLEVGDILFNRTNSEELVGKSAVVEVVPRSMSFASYLIRLKTEADVEPMFVAAWINSAFGRKWIRANKSQQVGQANLSGGKLRCMPIPFPPSSEQAEIVRRLSEAVEIRADQDSDFKSARDGALGLRQSVLKAAFEGRLVEQNSNDEAADQLLSRIAREPKQRSMPRSRRAAVVQAEQ